MLPPSSSSRWPNSAIVAVVVVGLLALMLGGWAVVEAVRISQLNEQLDAARSALADAEDRIDNLEQELADAQSAAGSNGSPFGDLFGGGEGGVAGLEDLLRGLLGGDSSGLSGLEDLLGGLLGGQSGDLGDLGDLFGGLDPSAGLGSCLTGVPGSFAIADGTLEGQVDDVARAVEDLRGLSFPVEVEPVFVSHEEMAGRVRDLVAESYPSGLVDFDTRLLVALGMLPVGYDLMEAQLDLLDTGVAGYYDPDTTELVVATPAGDQPLPAIDQITLAHEMIHALTDATLGIPETLDDPEADPEIVRAEQALIEGDATLGMQQFAFGALGLEAQLAMLMDPRLLGAQQEAGEFPYVLSSGLQLPYLEGMAFTCALYQAGGWDAVNEAYDNPPTNTSQILFPERYLVRATDEVEPQPIGSPGRNWESLRTVGFGAFDLMTLFSAPGDDVDAALDDPWGPGAGLGRWAGGSLVPGQRHDSRHQPGRQR